VFAVVAAGARAGEPLAVGFAQEDVTPDPAARTVWMAGFGQGRKATAVHDPVWARALVIQADGKRIALVSVDVIGLFHESVERIRKQLDGFDYVLVSSTHSHEGPDTMGLWGQNPATSGVDRDYLARLEAGVAAAARSAAARAEPVAASFAAAADATLVADGRQPYVKDDELRVLLFRRADGKPAGVLVQWNCHPETLDDKNTLVSSDFPHFTREYLEKVFDCPVAFFSGAIGGMMTSLGLEVRDEAGNKLEDGTFEKTQVYGRRIGQFADQTIRRAEPIRLTPIRLRSRKLFLPQDNPIYTTMFTLGVVDRRAFRWDGSPDSATPAPGRLLMGRMAIQSEVGVLRLGELTMIAVPGEIYPELVRGGIQDPQDPAADFPGAAKEPVLFDAVASGKRMIFGLANDEIGYIIPKSQWDTKAPYCYGRQKPQYGEVNSLGPETAAILCEAIVRLLKE
jgi:hypothetical protein